MGMGVRGFSGRISGLLGRSLGGLGREIGRRVAGAPRRFRGEKSGPPWMDLPCPRQRGKNPGARHPGWGAG